MSPSALEVVTEPQPPHCQKARPGTKPGPRCARAAEGSSYLRCPVRPTSPSLDTAGPHSPVCKGRGASLCERPSLSSVIENCTSGTFLAGSEESIAVKPPSEAITARVNLDLVQGNLVFPRCRVATAWVVLNQCLNPKVCAFTTIKLSKSQRVLSDKRFNSLQQIVNFLFLLQGFFRFGFWFCFLPPSGFRILLLCKSLSVLLLMNETEQFSRN